MYFGAMVVDVKVFTIVVAVVGFDGQRLYHRKEHSFGTPLLSIARVCVRRYSHSLSLKWMKIGGWGPMVTETIKAIISNSLVPIKATLN